MPTAKASSTRLGLRWPAVAASAAARGARWSVLAAFAVARAPQPLAAVDRLRDRAFPGAEPVAVDAVAPDWSLLVPAASTDS